MIWLREGVNRLSLDFHQPRPRNNLPFIGQGDRCNFGTSPCKLVSPKYHVLHVVDLQRLAFYRCLWGIWRRKGLPQDRCFVLTQAVKDRIQAELTCFSGHLKLRKSVYLGSNHTSTMCNMCGPEHFWASVSSSVKKGIRIEPTPQSAALGIKKRYPSAWHTELSKC